MIKIKKKFNFLTPSIAFAVIFIFMTGFQSETEDQGSSLLSGLEYQRPAFKFTEVVDGVYQATGTENLPVWCNAAIIINEADVIIVDTHIIPAAVAALLEELKEITDKPVRYVINTHFHFDHVFGNQGYSDDVEIISHESTREAIASGASKSGRAYDLYIGRIPNQISSLKKQLETVSDPEQRDRLELRLVYQENLLAGVRTVEPKAPNISFKKQMTLYRGEREIRILYFGRGHTEGNVVVHLPRENILITGDLIFESLSYMGNGFFAEWPETLERLKSLEFDWILPGHGTPFQDRNRIDYFQSYLRDFWKRVQTSYQAGVSAEEAAKQIDMRDHTGHYPEIRNAGVPTHAMERAYELLDQGKR
ncbi:MAG: MBL fold metallo-hydrolase [bacterium]|nr:MBL fold metallo-hydrolase [bacterium]